MDQHGEKEENNSQESASAAADRREGTAAAEGEDTSSEESMDHRDEDGYKADESTGLLEDDVRGSEDASAPPQPFAHPCSLLRAFAGCLGLLGCCGDQKPPAAPVAATEEAATATAAAARASQEEEAGGEKAPKANQQQTPPPQGFYMQEVITRVWAVVLRPRPPDHAREGRGGDGGAHH